MNRPLLQRLFLAAAAALLWLPASQVGAVNITNTARISYSLGSNPQTVQQDSNAVTLSAATGPTPAVVTFLGLAPGAVDSQILATDGAQCANAGGTFSPVSGLQSVTGQALSFDGSVALRPVTVFHAGEPILIQLADANRDTDPTARDRIEVVVRTGNGDQERLRLQETGVSTGVFVGPIQSRVAPPNAVPFDCRLSVSRDGNITVSYADSFFPGDIASANVLVDPFGILFDSRTGAPVDGITVRLVNTDTGLPATVFGDDGVSAYPSVNITGGRVTDASGVVYQFPPGGFRFPFIPPGNYRLVVEAPPGFNFPSGQPLSEILNLRDSNGNPFAIVLGSQGQSFPVVGGPAINIDLPFDTPQPIAGSAQQTLVVNKTASRADASVGDFVQYVINLSNGVSSTARNAVITDVLPVGFRYRAGSTRRNGVKAPEPTVAGDGRSLSFAIGALAGNGSVQISYVAEITAGAKPGEAVNRAAARADGARSNEALAAIRVKDAFFGNCGIVVGRVVEGACEVPWEKLKGVGNVKVMLEDGTYTTTDKDGQYHFERVCDGTHVVQLDLDTLPADLEAQPCIQNTRFAGRSFSQFVDVQGGALWRADFYTRARPPIEGAVGIRLKGTLVPPAAARSASRRITLPVQFDTRKASLKAEGVAALEQLLAGLSGPEVDRIEVVGHTDNVGIAPQHRQEFADNTALSAARAATVGEFLRSRLGLASGQIVTEGRGESQPVADNASESGRSRNRRVEVVIHPKGQASVPGQLQYRVEVDGGAVAVDKLRSTVFLPDGVTLVPGTTRLDGKAVADPEVSEGVATFTVGSTQPQFKHVIEFGATLPATGPAPAAAQRETLAAQFESRKASLTPEGAAALDALAAKYAAGGVERLGVVGHTDNVRIAPENRGEFADNTALSAARAATIAEYLRAKLGLSAAQVSATGRGEAEPVADNRSAEGRARNRRVEISVQPKAAAAAGACPARGYEAKAIASFATALKPGASTPPVSASLPCAALPAAGATVRETVFFDSSTADLNAEARRKITDLGQSLTGASVQSASVVGHADGRTLTTETAESFTNNRRLSQARAETVAAALGQQLALPPAQIGISAKGATAPLASNATPEGQALNRRAEIAVNTATAGESRAAPVTAESAYASATAQAKPASVRGSDDPLLAAKRARRAAIADDATAAGANTNWLVGQTAGIDWLYPQEASNPRLPATRVVIKHRPGERVVLKQEGIAVNPLSFDGALTSADQAVQVGVWRGLPLVDGPNRFTADIVAADGRLVQSLQRTVYYANAPVEATLVEADSITTADGVTKPVIAVRLTDANGKPVRAGVTGPFQLDPPYQTQQEIERAQTRQLALDDGYTPTYRVEGDEGIAYVELAPTSQSGYADLQFLFRDERGTIRRKQVRTWIQSAQRDWVLVGFGEGTVGYNTLSGQAQALQAADDNDKLYTNGQLAFYAKGRVQGKWLATISYDTKKFGNALRQESLAQVIDPDEYYQIYGDTSEQRYDAPSQKRLYVKVERDKFYALFGDYETGLTQTQLSRYSRALNGVKSEYAGDRFAYTVFAAETSQSFQRDEIQGNGTSGLYRFSRGRIVINSERISLVTRDRVRSELVLDTKALFRHLDYDIDYTNGTIFFREPVNSRDTSFNPVFIQAEYEVTTNGEKNLNAGGRASASFLDGKVQVGGSYIRDERQTGTTDLAGLDAKVRLGATTELRLEGARTDGELGNSSRSGNAWLAEVEHSGSHGSVLGYARRQDADFGVNQQSGFEAGSQKYGVSATAPLGEKYSVNGEAFRLENLQNDVTRNAGALRLERKLGNGEVFVGGQMAQDESSALRELAESKQLIAGVSQKFFNNKLELLERSDFSLGGRNDSVDFPTRHVVQAGYNVTDDTKLILAQEFTQGEAYDSSTTRIGAVTSPWNGGKINSTLNQSISEFGPRTYALYGLSQSFLVGKGWGLDFSLDRSDTFKESGQRVLDPNPNFPTSAGGINGGGNFSGDLGGNTFATGASGITSTLSTEDFTAATVGATYRAALWSWNGRAEMRMGEREDRKTFVTGFIRQAEAGVAYAGSARVFDAQNSSGASGVYGSADLSLAYRPLGQRWSILERFQYRHDALAGGSGVPGTGLFGANTLATAGSGKSRALVNHLNLNRVSKPWTTKDREGNLFRLNQRTQFSLFYGAKYSFDRYDGVSYSGFTDLWAVEVRHDLTRHFDIGAQASVLHSWDADNYSYSFGPMVGASPVDNFWMSLGYNFKGFSDRDFSDANYTAQGPFLKARFKFDQLTRPFGDDASHPQAVTPMKLSEPAVTSAIRQGGGQ